MKYHESLIPKDDETLSKTVETKSLETKDADSIIIHMDGKDTVSQEDLLRQYSLKQLRVMCAENNLSNVGNKSDLAKRLETALKPD